MDNSAVFVCVCVHTCSYVSFLSQIQKKQKQTKKMRTMRKDVENKILKSGIPKRTIRIIHITYKHQSQFQNFKCVGF